MPRIATYPDIIDECKTVSITKLKEWGYLNIGSHKEGTIWWSRHGERYASIGIEVNLQSPEPYLRLDYTCRNKTIIRNYKINFVSKPSNIGNGNVWYFICPLTKKLCRKLYCYDTYFLHRTAFKGLLYEKQTYSKKMRYWNKVYAHELSDHIYEEIHKKYFKKTYAGKPTKKYNRILKKITLN